MKISSKILMTCYLLVTQSDSVTAADAECGAPRCVHSVVGKKNCGDPCDNPCTLLDSGGFTNFPPSGCSFGSGGCGSLEICATYEGQQKIVEFYGDSLDEDDCCKTKCFSSMATAVVESKGKTPLKDVQVGDKVLTGSGDFKTVYTVDHRELDEEEQFLQIYSSDMETPLELTQSHMVFVTGKKNPIPASKIEVGDALQTVAGSSTVTKISSVTRNGFWNIITTDGTVVVDGITASTYSITFGEEHITIGGFKIMSHHDFVHLAMAPYRSLCLGVSLTFCENKDGYNGYNKIGAPLLKFGREQNAVVQGFMIVGLLIAFSFFSFATSPIGVTTAFALAGGACYFLKNKKKNSNVVY